MDNLINQLDCLMERFRPAHRNRGLQKRLPLPVRLPWCQLKQPSSEDCLSLLVEIEEAGTTGRLTIMRLRGSRCSGIGRHAENPRRDRGLVGMERGGRDEGEAERTWRSGWWRCAAAQWGQMLAQQARQKMLRSFFLWFSCAGHATKKLSATRPATHPGLIPIAAAAAGSPRHQ